MTARQSLLTDELRRWIGRQARYTAPEEVGRASIRYFALALGDDNPLYQDETFAGQTRFGGIVAPPTLICETSQHYHRQADDYGYIGHTWDLPLPPSRLIRGGNEYQFFQPVRPGDRITATWRIGDIYERATGRGGFLLFVISEVTYHNQDGELLASNRETVMYQPLGDGDVR